MRQSLSQRTGLCRSGRRPAALALALLLLSHPLAGCAITGEEIAAALDIPERYREAPRNPDRALPHTLWWRGFRSNELTDLVEEAVTSNLDIAVAVARIVQADAQSRVAGAALLPTVDLDSSAARSRPPGGPDRSAFNLTLSASYEIDFWGRNRALMRAAEELAVASRFEREVVMLTTVASVMNIYFRVLQAQDRLRVARENIAAASRVLKLIQERFDVGTASDLDRAQQESVLATERATIPPLEQSVRQDKATLAVLIGRPPERVNIRGGSMSRIAIPPVTPGLPSDLIAQRPDIRQAEAQLASVNADVHAARAAFFPSIRLTGDGGVQSAALQALFRPESVFYNVAASLTQPIFDGARLQGLYDLQKGRQDEFLQGYRRAVINGFADVDRALIAVQQTAQRERLQRDVVNSTRRAFEIAETRLREGTVDLVTVLNTQQALFQAQDVLAQARLLRFQAVVGLFQALGGGWQYPPEKHPEEVRRP
jgi:NodT family efflux transporter outer membrane factor (OMF) lipoprotein